jgi:hypothetical protein
MAFVKLTNNLFDRTSLLLRPKVKFVSSSLGLPATGSQYVSPVRSKCIKDIVDPAKASINQISSRNYNELDFSLLNNINAAGNALRNGTVADVSKFLDLYMKSVNKAPHDPRFSKFIDVFRFGIPVKFNQNFNIKNNIRKSLYPFHRHRYPDAGFHYTNYNTLNFYTGSNTPKDSCLIYPNITNQYTPDAGFTLDFWINPRYSNQVSSEHYTAGTIFHMSSSICLSLVSGSMKDKNDLVDDFKLLLQLSQSADLNPSSINLNSPVTSYPNDLIYTSSHTLNKNNWHHISVSWGGSQINYGTGSLYIDDQVTSFHIPSSSICQSNEIITIGNYLNTDSVNASKFFNSTVSSKQGLTQLNAGTLNPANESTILNNGLNAEIHDIKLFNQCLFADEINQIKNEGIYNKRLLGSERTNIYDDLLFYIPVFFYPITRSREVLVTPFQEITSTTNDPFNVQFSFGVNGKLINLENFTREFIKGEFPRLQALTASTIDDTIQDITADQFVYNSGYPGYHSGSLIKRNNLILPNDNGLFKPDYYPIQISAASDSNTYYKNKTHIDYSRISLENLIPSSSLFDGLVFQSGSIFDQIVGSTPENPGVAPGSVLTIAQRTRDLSSNEITIFDISNLYYGNKIHPGSFSIIDTHLTGTNERVKIKLSDNKKGSLFRNDCLTQVAEWNNVGDILYEEGMVVIKSPHLMFFCKDRLEMDFKGEQNIHTMLLNVPAEKGMFNSSSNKTFKSVAPSDKSNDRDLESIYITAVNIHDNNFNIIMKAHFAQHILKTEDDEFVIRLKQDF